MVRYFCDDCGKELFMPGHGYLGNVNVATYMNEICNCDGFKYYVSPSNMYLDLCEECKQKKKEEPGFARHKHRHK